MDIKPVMVCNEKEALDNFSDLLSRVGFEPKKWKLALVKPNICGLYHPDFSLLKRIVDFLEPHAERIVIGETESMIHSPQEQFRRLGIYELLKDFQGRAEAKSLSGDRVIKVRVPSPHVIGELLLPETVVRCDLLINVPRVGTHSTTSLTCALKNLFGLLSEKRKHSTYHPLGMEEVIADIAKVVKTDLNVVDAGSRVILGLDPLTVDIIASKLIQINPLDVKHLRLVSEDRGQKLESVINELRVI